MAENGKPRGFLGALQSAVDSVKSTVQDIKVPEIKIPEVKLPEVKLSDIKLPNLLQKKEEFEAVSDAGLEIRSISVQSAIRIAYYMMTVDGTIHEDEEQRFDEIGKELDPEFASNKDAIVASCKKQMDKIIDPDDYYSVLQDGVEEAIANGKNSKGAALAPKVLVWDLLTIAYSDGAYDENERKLLKYIVRKFNIDKSVFLELESSYLTLRDLENELNWIKTTDRPYLTIETMVNEISDRKNAIFENVKDLILL